MPNADRMEQIVSLCKRRGFIFPGSEIYGGFANSWDYGPYGVELRKNIRDAWWERFVRGREDVVGVETPVIMHPRVWEASGHVATFTDPLVECAKCRRRHRADQLEKPECPDCGGKLGESKQFNLMFKTSVGATNEATAAAYLRPETAQGMFVAWKNVRDTVRKRLPFGAAQIGKAFRNEITPGNFIFRTREFEQMEIEYFVQPRQADEAFELWLGEMKSWVRDVLKLSTDNVVYHEIEAADRAFYSKRTIDVEYRYPFGLKELYGLADRGDYDLSRHAEYSQEDLTWLDPDTNQRLMPHVIEPTWGLDRTLLVLLCEHLDVDEAPTADEDNVEPRMVLRLPPRLAPVKVAVLPLQKKNGLPEMARELVASLRSHGLATEYDESGSIGKRYRRQDEIGTPWCVTLDPESVTDRQATLRDRDAMTQKRIALEEIPELMANELRTVIRNSYHS